MNMPAQSVPAAPAAQSPASEGVNWGDLATDFDGSDAFVLEPEVGDSLPAESAQAPGAVTPAGVEQQQTPPPAVEPPQAPSQVQQPQTPQQPVAQPPSTPEAPQPPINVEELRAAYAQSLSQDYAITPDDALLLSTQPEVALPRLAANMHLRVMQDVIRHVQTVFAGVPQMLSQQMEQQRAEQEAKQEFYSAWPGLSSHHDRVVSNAALVRQANPQATRAQVIEMAGMMTAMALGLDPAAVRTAQQVAAQHTIRQTPGIPPRPAAVGSSPSMAPTSSNNIFESFADEDTNWMRG